MSGSDRALLSRLFVESHTALRRYVGRLVRSPEAREDIVQEAFLRTFEQAQRVEAPRSFLFSTARNLAFDASKQGRSRRTETVADFDRSGLAGREPSLEHTVLADEESQLLRQAVERLPPQCRAAFALRVFHACSYKEIARQLDLSPKTVEKHIARALRDTHEYLRRRYQIRRSS